MSNAVFPFSKGSHFFKTNYITLRRVSKKQTCVIMLNGWFILVKSKGMLTLLKKNAFNRWRPFFI